MTDHVLPQNKKGENDLQLNLSLSLLPLLAWEERRANSPPFLLDFGPLLLLFKEILYVMSLTMFNKEWTSDAGPNEVKESIVPP